MSADTGDWHAPEGDVGDPGRYAFAGGAYQLSGTGGNTAGISAWAPGVYGDAAVEVTARQTGSAENDGVGLVARADSSRMLMFAVNTTGDWRFSIAPTSIPGDTWSIVDEGQSDTAVTGDGAVNRLLLVMRGQTYLYYINGHLVGSYTDRFVRTPTSGHVGVILLTGATRGAFSDFAVYPVQPSSSFCWI